MSEAPTPPPPPPSGSASAGAAAATNDTNEALDWRVSVPQSARNAEVREIARVLASLEPGATENSKKRLAMQFEDSVFKQATDLSDYRKRLTKRLKKVQKSYVPPVAAASSTDATRMATLLALRAKHGEAIKYILRNAETAVQQMKIKHGAEKANQLRQHTDGVLTWANDLGLAEGGGVARTTPNPALTDADVQKLQGLLERRMENIRSHVIKLADPDGFLGETLAKTDTDLTDRARKVLAATCKRRYEQLSRATTTTTTSSSPATTPTTTTPAIAAATTAAAAGTVEAAASTLLQQALQTLRKPVPLPTRDQRNDAQIGLLHLEKMAASSSILLGWALTPHRSELPAPHLLSAAHEAAKEGADAVTRVMADVRRALGETKQGTVALEDAWKKTLAIPSPSIESLEETTSAPSSSSAGHLPRPSTAVPPQRPVLQCRVLLKPGRKVPSNVLNALRRKRARLVRPPPRGEGSHLILDVGGAFSLTIYFVPLLVTIRAQKQSVAATGALDDARSDDDGWVGCATMKPLCYGFDDYQLTEDVVTTSASRSNINRDAPSASTSKPLQVWGVRGPVELLGRVVEERLRDAGAHATAVLRACFAANWKPSANDFEVELLEATSLLEFVQIARTTYEPDWQDDDV